jgi:peptidoglycan/LPS O-acetylase OafA/YrhL
VFYARRILRIFPLYFFYLFLILIVGRIAWLWYSGHDLWGSVQPWTYVTYLMNWKADHGYTDRYLDHLWSLAVEEQFYLVWPAAVWLIPRRGLSWFCLALCAAGLAVRFFLGRLSAFSSEDIYRMTPCHLDSLAVGALVALGIRDFRSSVEQWKPLVVAICITGFLYVFAISPGQVWSDPPMRTVGVTLLALLYGSIVFQAATVESGLVQGLFSNNLLRSCGKYSYGMYVYHSALWQLSVGPVRDLSSDPLPRAIVLTLKYLYPPILIGFSFAAAWISWKFLEQPFLLLKSRFPYEEG